MTSPLPSGVYVIINEGTKQAVGATKVPHLEGTLPIRSTEDSSVRPDIQFKITHLKDNNYTVEVEGLPVVGINGHVVALVNPTVHVEWEIKPLPHIPGTREVFAIKQVEPVAKGLLGITGYGWVLNNPEAGTDVTIKGLMLTGPPLFHNPTQAWVFEKV
ncbi:hypothetical protein H0H81_011425 [Sphagnurus paluster]|uniref:Uncharacterized protein n=1 Tax=Sphagnurus paluster TaxID=117069 RepID=A0A9P7GSC2_9AGAR|nr:hypothetical protein H0H81_011425 [Sphagnurus paluster]